MGASHNAVEYPQGYEMMKQYDSLVNYFSSLTSEVTIFKEENKKSFNAIMWIFDNMLLEGATDEEVEEFLKRYAGYTDESLNSALDKENVLTRADIEAIQQLVIWYFTNHDQEAYNKETLPTLYVSVKGSDYFDTANGAFESFADIYNGWDGDGNVIRYGEERQEKANILYQTLIAKGKESAESGTYRISRGITIYLGGGNAATDQPIAVVKEAEKTSVTINKIWADNNNQDGKRASYTVKLTGMVGDIKLYEDIQVLDKETITYTWDKLNKYSDGEEIIYTVEEIELPEGYTKEITGNVQDGYVITNTHIPEKIRIKLNKIWADNNDQDGKRANYTVRLTGTVEGTKVYEDSQILEKGTLEYTWENLNKYSNGKEIEYTIEETEVPEGYTKEIIGNREDGFTITNTHIPEKVDIEVNKIWEDNGNQDGKRANYTVRLTGTVEGTKVYEDDQILDRDTLKYTWENLNKYANGKEIVYTVEEIEIPEGYTKEITGNKEDGYVITNTHIPEKIRIKANKIWNDNNDQDGKRTNYAVTLTGVVDNIKVYENSQILDKDTLEYTWNDLPKYGRGQEIIYTIEETEVPEGYTKEITGNKEDGYVITNTHIPEKIRIKANKIWNDNNDQDGKRTNYTVTLTGIVEGTKVYEDDQILDKDTLEYTWENLNKYSNGKEIIYTIEETKVPEGYTKEITGNREDGYVITNTHIPEKIDIEVNKVWEDNENQDGKRANYTVTLTGVVDGIKVYENSQTLDKDTVKHTWMDLNKYSNGKEIIYTVEETEIPEGYIAQVTKNAQDRYIITNTHVPEKIRIKANKIWNDNNDQDGKRANYTVTLTGIVDNIKVYENDQELNKDTLEYTWENLNKYINGKEIIYTVEETEIPEGYTKEITGNAQDGYIITNTHIQEKISIKVNKVWEDNGNQDGKRANYTVRLTGTVEGTKVYEDSQILEKGTLECTWENLNKYSNGKEILYTVEEIKIPEGYTAQVTGNAENGYVITNTHIPEKTSVKVNKVWNDNDDQDGLRGSYTVTLTGIVDGIKIYEDSKVLDKNTLEYIWNDLPKYGRGQEVIYTVEETQIPRGYTKIIVGNQTTGYIITNTHIPEKINISISKTWEDSNNQDGKRGDYTVTLTGAVEGTKIYEDSQTLEKDKLEYTWENLNKYSNGRRIVYTIEETEMPEGYTASIVGSEEEGYTITNTYQAEKTSVTVNKIWEDFNNQNGKRANYTVKLIGTVEGIKVYENSQILEEDTLEYTWENLNKYSNGKIIVYTVEESEIPKGYTAKIEGNQTTGYTITNTYNPHMDLSLRKYIVAIDGKELNKEDSREPVVDTKLIDNRKSTTAEYKHDKNPIMVNKGSLVTYKIRVYNEGEADGYVGEITDYLPNYLIYLEENEINKKYGWIYNKETREVKTNITAKDNQKGKEIYKDRENESMLSAYDGQKVLNYIDVEIVCKVDEKALRKRNTNQYSTNNKNYR